VAGRSMWQQYSAELAIFIFEGVLRMPPETHLVLEGMSPSVTIFHWACLEWPPKTLVACRDRTAWQQVSSTKNI
jgi:hypothetical protein